MKMNHPKSKRQNSHSNRPPVLNVGIMVDRFGVSAQVACSEWLTAVVVF